MLYLCHKCGAAVGQCKKYTCSLLLGSELVRRHNKQGGWKIPQDEVSGGWNNRGLEGWSYYAPKGGYRTKSDRLTRD